jgi:hypothetical protein
MIRQLCISICLALVSAAIPLRAANRPHAGTDSQTKKVWTNDDLEKLHAAGLISIVGQADEGTSVSESAPRDYEVTQDPQWYAEQAARLRDELEYRQAQLREYRQAIEDAQTLRESTGGINIDEGDIGITPEAGSGILQQRVNETQTELDALEDLARRNDISPGTLRGQ